MNRLAGSGREVQEFGKHKGKAREYAKHAIDGLNNSKTRGASLLALRSLGEAFRVLDAVAAEAGIARATLRRVLSSKGNPRMKVIEAVLKPLGLRLSVVPQPKKAHKRAARKPAKNVRPRAA